MITLQNSSVTFQDNCDMISNSISLLKPYRTIQIQASVVKNTVKIVDITFKPCNPSPKISVFMKIGMALFGIPFKCPITNERVFSFNNSKITSLDARTKRLLPILFSDGQEFIIKYFISHDTGTSCFEGVFDIITK